MSIHSIDLLDVEPAPEAVSPVLEFANVAIEERDQEIASLRERLNYYQGFDSVINESVQRAADLFRSMYEERESIRLIGTQKQAEIEAEATLAAELRFSAERERFQAILMTLMDEASRMQRQLDSLMQRIAEAVAEVKPASQTEHPDFPRLSA